MEQIKQELTGLKLKGMAHCLQTLEETRRVYELSLVDGLSYYCKLRKTREPPIGING